MLTVSEPVTTHPSNQSTTTCKPTTTGNTARSLSSSIDQQVLLVKQEIRSTFRPIWYLLVLVLVSYGHVKHVS